MARKTSASPQEYSKAQAVYDLVSVRLGADLKTAIRRLLSENPDEPVLSIVNGIHTSLHAALMGVSSNGTVRVGEVELNKDLFEAFEREGLVDFLRDLSTQLLLLLAVFWEHREHGIFVEDLMEAFTLRVQHLKGAQVTQNNLHVTIHRLRKQLQGTPFSITKGKGPRKPLKLQILTVVD